MKIKCCVLGGVTNSCNICTLSRKFEKLEKDEVDKRGSDSEDAASANEDQKPKASSRRAVENAPNVEFT